MQVSKGISQKSGTLTTTCVYDALGQLVRVDDPHENATWVYEYDRGGNMTKRKKYAYTTGSLDGLSYSLRSYTYDSTWKDQLVSNGSYPLTYDAIGNLRTYADWEYEWEGGRRLKKQTQNTTVVTYDYDQNGMRVRKTVSHTNGYVYAVYNYVYNGTKLVHMTKNNDVLHFFYDNEGRPASVRYNGDMYNYLYNLQGDIVAIVDSNGAIAVEYKYNAWGSILSRTGTLSDTLGYSNPFRYRRYIYDDETCMYWLKSRYYYPELFRFINLDKLLIKDFKIFDLNSYTYCSNRPISSSDENGFHAIDVNGGVASPADRVNKSKVPPSLNPYKMFGYGADVTMPLIDMKAKTTFIDNEKAAKIENSIRKASAYGRIIPNAILSTPLSLISGFPGFAIGIAASFASIPIEDAILPTDNVAVQSYNTIVGVYDASQIQDNLIYVLVKNYGAYESALCYDWNVYGISKSDLNYNDIFNEALMLDRIS